VSIVERAATSRNSITKSGLRPRRTPQADDDWGVSGDVGAARRGQQRRERTLRTTWTGSLRIPQELLRNSKEARTSGGAPEGR
jgi:hypothetical protein